VPYLQEEDAPLPDDSSMISIFRSCSSRSFLQVRHSYRATQPVRRPHCWHLAQGLVMTQFSFDDMLGDLLGPKGIQAHVLIPFFPTLQGIVAGVNTTCARLVG
jgi:hypothetical protein